MSLEAVLEKNNALLSELIALWKSGVAPAPAPLAATVDAKSEPAKVVSEKKEPAAAPATVQPTVATDAGAQPSTEATVTYDQIKPLIIKVNTTKGREAATALLAEFKVARGPDLKAEQYAAFFKRATEVLA